MGAALQPGELPSLPRAKNTFQQSPSFYLVFGLIFFLLGLGQLVITTIENSYTLGSHALNFIFAAAYLVFSAVYFGKYFMVRRRAGSDAA